MHDPAPCNGYPAPREDQVAERVQPVRIAPDELDQVLYKAHAEQWRELVLLGPGVA